MQERPVDRGDSTPPKHCISNFRGPAGIRPTRRPGKPIGDFVRGQNSCRGLRKMASYTMGSPGSAPTFRISRGVTMADDKQAIREERRALFERIYAFYDLKILAAALET